MAWQRILFCTIALGMVSNVYALPFEIVLQTGTSLPTQVVQGQVVYAFYTINNASSRMLPNSYVQSLPPGVTQITQNSAITNLCGATFSLAPHGSLGDSCTLQLAVNGAVNALDPDPAHHLFVCAQGGKSCAGTYQPLNVSVSTSSQWVVAGTQNSSQGVVVTTQDAGENWQFQVLAYPDNTQASSFNGSSCADSQCVVLGQYQVNSSQEPGIATTNLSELPITWSQQILHRFDINELEAVLYGVNCMGSNCVAAGGYVDVTKTVFPYITQSSDYGNTWTQQVLAPIAPMSNAIFIGVNCSENLCATVGVYFDENFIPSAAVGYSSDKGHTWQQQGLPVAENTYSNILYGVSCIGNTCIAVGDYLDDSDNDHPGVAITTDAGGTWSNRSISTLPEPYTQGEWQAISCASNYCVAVGYYSSVSYVGYLGVALSRDLGQTWSQQVLPLPSDPSGLINGQLTGVKCFQNTCIAVGNYYDNNYTPYPVFIKSTDAGLTWSQQVFSNYAGTSISSIG